MHLKVTKSKWHEEERVGCITLKKIDFGVLVFMETQKVKIKIKRKMEERKIDKLTVLAPFFLSTNGNHNYSSQYPHSSKREGQHCAKALVITL